ncbi:hypothetical protein ACP4OV_005850 [Aristida adscensionis]
MSDDVVWDCIRHGHCSFMAKIETNIFCRNPYNATGICNRSSCPLANSRYATIRDHDGVFYLYMKTAERVYLPNKMWERVKLPRNYDKAIEVIDKHLIKEKIVTAPRNKSINDITKIEKADIAAQIAKCVQEELLERLKKGCYGGIYNYSFDDFDTILHDKGDLYDIEDIDVQYVAANDIEIDIEDVEDFEGHLISKDANIEEDDDLIYGLVARKQKGLGSTSRPKIGKRSTKVITELEHDEDTHRKQRTRV